MQINLMPDLSLIAVMVIFIMNYVVVRKFFLEPVNRVMEEREHETRTAEDLYSGAMAKLNEATEQIEAQVHEARRQGTALRERLRAEAATHRASLVERTRSQAEQVLTEADAKLRGDVDAARQRIETEAESLARDAAERILGRTV